MARGTYLLPEACYNISSADITLVEVVRCSCLVEVDIQAFELKVRVAIVTVTIRQSEVTDITN